VRFRAVARIRLRAVSSGEGAWTLRL